MNRKIGLLVATLILTSTLSADAQQPKKVPRIGYLTNAPLGAGLEVRNRDEFRNGLRELGYIEGKNILIEARSGELSLDRQRAAAAELVRLRMEIIVAGGAGDIRAAKEATAKIPIVMASC